MFFSFFFFQAEDGIRDLIVTGVQTCALPIWSRVHFSRRQKLSPTRVPLLWVSKLLFHFLQRRGRGSARRAWRLHFRRNGWTPYRSEERRVGKECRARWSASH